MIKKIIMLLLSIVLSIQPVFAFANAESNSSVYKVNELGQTYGKVAVATNAAYDPDLIYALATNGKYGYIKNEDLMNCGPLSPNDTEYESRVFGEKDYCIINVYEQDGTTVIGEFRIEKPSKNTGLSTRATHDPRDGYTLGTYGYIGIIDGIEYLYQNMKKQPTPFRTDARTIVEHTTEGTVPGNTYGAQARIININDAVVASSSWTMNSRTTEPGYVYADTSYVTTSTSPFYSYGLAKEWNGDSYWIHGGFPI